MGKMHHIVEHPSGSTYATHSLVNVLVDSVKRYPDAVNSVEPELLLWAVKKCCVDLQVERSAVFGQIAFNALHPFKETLEFAPGLRVASCQSQVGEVGEFQRLPNQFLHLVKLPTTANRSLLVIPPAVAKFAPLKTIACDFNPSGNIASP
jgi:hypothetical protein